MNTNALTTTPNTDYIEFYNNRKPGASWDKNGELIQEARQSKKVLAFHETDSRFCISAKKINSQQRGGLAFMEGLWNSLFYVKVDTEEYGLIALRVSSLSKRYHFSPKKIKQLAQLGSEALFNQLTSKTELLARSIDCYQSVLEFYVPHRNELVVPPSFPKEEVRVQKSFLMKAIKKGYKTLLPEGQSRAFNLDAQLLISRNSASRGLRLFQLTADELGSGSCAQVRAAVNLLKGKKKAFKMINLNHPDIAKIREYTVAEFNILHYLHTDSNNKKINPVGIQKEGSDLIEVGGDVWGYMTKLYETDYLNRLQKIPASVEEKVFEMYQVLSGACHNKNWGVCHYDLKIENILYERDDNQNFIVHIADYGMAGVLPESFPGLDSLPKLRGSTHYMATSDILERYALERKIIKCCDEIALLKLQEKNHSNIDELAGLQLQLDALWEEFKKLEYAREVFAIGVILYVTLHLGEEPLFPFPFAKIGKQEFQDTKNDLWTKDVNAVLPMGFSLLIHNMLSSDWRERKTIEEAFDTFKDCIGLLYANVKTKVMETFDQW